MCRSVSWIRSSTWPISRRTAESRRLAVSRTFARLSRHAVDRRDERPRTRRRPAAGAQPRELLADPVEPAIELADGPQRLAGLGQLLGLEDPADLGPPHELADVMQAAERRAAARRGSPRPSRSVSDWRSWISAGSMLGSRPQRPGLAQRAGRPRGDQRADLVELEEFQRVAVHV